MTPIGQDLRFALRQLRRRPGFAAVVVATLGLGIGANAAIFSVVDGVLLSPLPYPEPDRLMRVYSQFPGLGFDRFWVSAPEYLELARWNRSFSHLGAYARGAANVGGSERPVRARVAAVSASLFAALGVEAERGRTFTAEEDRPNAEPVAVLSSELWHQGWGGTRRSWAKPSRSMVSAARWWASCRPASTWRRTASSCGSRWPWTRRAPAGAAPTT